MSAVDSDEEAPVRLTRKQMQVHIILDDEDDDDKPVLVKQPAPKAKAASVSGAKDQHIIYNLKSSETPEQQLGIHSCSLGVPGN